jgi:hypothetical protein
MFDTSQVATKFEVVKKGDSLLPTLLNRIMAHENAQVLVLGRGVGAFYENDNLIPATLGKNWTILVPPNAPTRQQNEKGIMQYSAMVQEDATMPRVGLFMAYPEFVGENMFLPSKTGTYSASIYYLGLSETPLSDMDIYRNILIRNHIQTPLVECIFSADDNKLRISEQDEINTALLAHKSVNEILPRIIQNVQKDIAVIESRKFATAARSVSKKWWQFWR